MTIDEIFYRIETGTTTQDDAVALRQILARRHTISDWVRACGVLAETKGFELTRIDQQLLLIIDEVMEAYHKVRNRTGLAGNFQMEFSEELADVVIRTFSFCHGNNIRLEDAIIAKHGKNQDRPHKHGKDF
jgi:NTP pyrophosphatase (non-canonical NTP hydrolase)